MILGPAFIVIGVIGCLNYRRAITRQGKLNLFASLAILLIGLFILIFSVGEK